MHSSFVLLVWLLLFSQYCMLNTGVSELERIESHNWRLDNNDFIK